MDLTTLQPGVCLTFDDLHTKNWCNAEPLLLSYGARATFCVTTLHTASESQIQDLRFLQSQGHEIAYHTRTHPRLTPYLQAHGVQHWVENELELGIAEHRKLGFPASSYAAAFHASKPATRRACASRFEICRTKGPRDLIPEQINNRVYKRPGRLNMVHCIGSLDFCSSRHSGVSDTMPILDAIVRQKGVGIFCGHDIQRDGTEGLFSTQDQLEEFLKNARRLGLRFYTLTEFARLSAVASQDQ